jgi:Lon protease-like protein
MSQGPFSLDDFSGQARLFPLPNLVLFPHVAQPLHIFEPRYREMMADALADDRLLAMALLRPGWEEDYHKQPPIHPVVCLGRVMQEERLSDGRYHLLLHGLCRARILEELSTDHLYRTARVDLLRDADVECATADERLRAELSAAVTPFFSTHPPAMEQLGRLLKSGMPLGALCDIFGFALPLDLEVKQQLLEETDVEKRARRLVGGLAGKAPSGPPSEGGRSFPPKFSSN